ncbi:DUF1062 domain-containing protein [Streptomyces sp. NPDC001970]
MPAATPRGPPRRPTLGRRTRLPPVGIPLDHALQHPQTAQEKLPAQPRRLRDTARSYTHTCRIRTRTGVHFSGGTPALDWDNAWRLDTGRSDHLDREVIDVSVRFAARIPVRPVRLIAEGCGLPRAEVERLIKEGKLVSAVRLSGRLSGDFGFTLKR